MDGNTARLTVSSEEAFIRLDQFLIKRFPKQSRAHFQKLIEQSSVLLNEKRAKKRQQVMPGDEIKIEFADLPPSPLMPESIPLDILYEDEALIVINKPSGLVVHPGAGNWQGTLVNGLLYHCKDLARDSIRPGIVHRLDKETSGVLVAAKIDRAREGLTAQFMNRKVKKGYLAICVGNPGKVTIDRPLGRHPINRIKRAVTEGGKKAITHVETLETSSGLSFVQIGLETGRTHQIRVHLKAIGCPVLGDSLYGDSGMNQKWTAPHQMLHAAYLSFHHPLSNVPLTFAAPPPPIFEALKNKCGLTSRVERG